MLKPRPWHYGNEAEICAMWHGGTNAAVISEVYRVTEQQVMAFIESRQIRAPKVKQEWQRKR